MADKKANTSPEDILVGGQAVIEGVMMRTPHAYAVAVRRRDGTLETKRKPSGAFPIAGDPFPGR